MGDTVDPKVKQFRTIDVNGKDELIIHLGPEVGIITTTFWDLDENSEPKTHGKAQSITVSRHTLIGLAYEILSTLNQAKRQTVIQNFPE